MYPSVPTHIHPHMNKTSYRKLMDHIYSGSRLCPERPMRSGIATGNYITPNTNLLTGIISSNTNRLYYDHYKHDIILRII